MRKFLSPLLVISLGLLAWILAGCGHGLEGADFDKDLAKRADGLVYRAVDDRPYTGKAYQTVCGQDCFWFIHWKGEFKDGRKHGTFVFPESRKSNDFFRPGDKHVIRIKFRDGIEVGDEK